MRPFPPPQRATRLVASTSTQRGLSSATRGVTAQNARVGRPTERRFDEAHEVRGGDTHASTVETSARSPVRRRLTSRKLSSDERVVLTMTSASRSGNRAWSQSRHSRACSFTMMTSEVMPAAAEVPDHPLDQRHARDRTSGLGIEKPAARRRVPSPAAMMPPRQRAGIVTGAFPRARAATNDAVTAQHGRGSAAAAGTSQMCAMPTLRAPAMSRESESPTNVASAGFTPSSSSACLKIRGSGFFHPTACESTIA